MTKEFNLTPFLNTEESILRIGEKRYVIHDDIESVENMLLCVFPGVSREYGIMESALRHLFSREDYNSLTNTVPFENFHILFYTLVSAVTGQEYDDVVAYCEAEDEEESEEDEEDVFSYSNTLRLLSSFIQ